MIKKNDIKTTDEFHGEYQYKESCDHNAGFIIIPQRIINMSIDDKDIIMAYLFVYIKTDKTGYLTYTNKQYLDFIGLKSRNQKSIDKKLNALLGVIDLYKDENIIEEMNNYDNWYLTYGISLKEQLLNEIVLSLKTNFNYQKLSNEEIFKTATNKIKTSFFKIENMNGIPMSDKLFNHYHEYYGTITIKEFKSIMMNRNIFDCNVKYVFLVLAYCRKRIRKRNKAYSQEEFPETFYDTRENIAEQLNISKPILRKVFRGLRQDGLQILYISKITNLKNSKLDNPTGKWKTGYTIIANHRKDDSHEVEVENTVRKLLSENNMHVKSE